MPAARFDLTERVVTVLQEAEELARAMLDHPSAAHFPPDTIEKLRWIADECDFLAAQPLSRMIGYRRR